MEKKDKNVLCYDPCMKRSYNRKSPHQFVLKLHVKKYFFLYSHNFKNDFCLRLRKFHNICSLVYVFYLFIYYLKFSLSQDCVIITSFPSSFFFCRAGQKKTSQKDPYQLNSQSKIDDILEYWLYFDLKRGNFCYTYRP